MMQQKTFLLAIPAGKLLEVSETLGFSARVARKSFSEVLGTEGFEELAGI